MANRTWHMRSADNQPVTTCAIGNLDSSREKTAKAQAGIQIFLAVCVISALVGRFAYLYEPFNGDGAMFAYMGKLAAEGGRFGVDLVDNKFPTVGFMTSIFWRAFGAWWPGYVIAQTVMAFVAAAMLARAAARSFGEESRWATFLPAIVLMNLNAAVMGGFQLETIQTFFACIAGACALETLRGKDWRDALAMGLAAGCAILIKPTGASVLAAFVLAGIFQPRQIAVAFLGFSLPIAACGLWLWQSDQLRMMPEIARQIGDYAHSTSFDPWDLFRPFSLLLLFGAAMLIRGWVFRRRKVEASSQITAWVFIITWLTLEFVGVIMQRRMYAYHFLPLVGPAALAFGALPRKTTVTQLGGCLAIPLMLNVWGAVDVVQAAQRTPQTWSAITAWLDDYCQPGERIWRDQTMYVLLHSDLRPASRIQLTFIFMNTNNSAGQFGKMLTDDLAQHQPGYVVLPADVEAHIHHQTTHVVELSRIPERKENFTQAWRDIRSFVEARYEPVRQFGDEMIWRRIDSLTPPEDSPGQWSRSH